MNIRKKTIVGTAFVITLFSVSTTYAQKHFVVIHDSAGTKKIWEDKRPLLKTDLQLTDEQADSIVTINIYYQYRRDTIGADWHLEAMAKMDRYKILMQAMDARLQAALGNDLFARYEAWLHDHSRFANKKK